MRILCSTFGSSGDVYPMFGLALELRRRGHEVTFATNGHYAGLAERHGVPFVALGDEEVFRACTEHPDLWHPRRAFGHLMRWLKPTQRRLYDLHADLASRTQKGEALAVSNCFGFGARVAQERGLMRLVTIHLQPSVLWSDVDPPRLPGMFGPNWLRRWLFRIGQRWVVDPEICPFLNAWRAEFGLSPMRRILEWWHSPDQVIGMFPDWFASAKPDWPAPFAFAGFPLWNEGSDAGLSAEVRAFLHAGPKPVVCTPGTANRQARAFFAAAADALARQGRRGIFLTEFPEQLPSPLPAGVAHFRYVPLDLLLPHAKAFVHHGGVGSTSQAFAAGVPQVAMAMAHDQFDNAARIERLGVGVGLPASRFTAARLADALARLATPSFASACRDVAGRMSNREGLSRAADLVEATRGR